MASLLHQNHNHTIFPNNGFPPKLQFSSTHRLAENGMMNLWAKDCRSLSEARKEPFPGWVEDSVEQRAGLDLTSRRQNCTSFWGLKPLGHGLLFWQLRELYICWYFWHATKYSLGSYWLVTVVVERRHQKTRAVTNALPSLWLALEDNSKVKLDHTENKLNNYFQK